MWDISADERATLVPVMPFLPVPHRTTGAGKNLALMFRAQGELGAAVARYRTAFLTVALLSALLNFLLLGGSFYMMLVYDSVLPSHSIPTLFGLLAMVIVVYIFQGMFDLGRSAILASVGAGLERQLAPRVQTAISEMALHGGRTAGDGLTPMRDLDQVRGFLASNGPAALIDLPWILFFLLILFALHVWLGVIALAGAILLVGLTWLTDLMTREPTRQMSQIASYRSGYAEANLRHVEILTALGMRERMRLRWERINGEYLKAQGSLAHTASLLGGISRVFRMFLQSAVLTVGALLVIDGKASGGVIFASSILFGRALAPVDSAIANWRNFAAARGGWQRLNDLLARVPASVASSVALPLPSRELVVRDLFVAPPGTQRVTVQGANFALKAGDAVAVIGPSGAGKTTLGRALIGLWRPQRGTIRLDGATLDQWSGEQLGEAIGYLPQAVELLDGSVAQNIARFVPFADSELVMAAAREAGVHDMIVQLPQGYDTPVGRDGAELSAGQRQRIGLARALFGKPFLVLLDEPNSNLDADGDAALEQAIASVRERLGIVIVVAHRPSVLSQVSHALFLRGGRMEAFGGRDEVLEKVLGKPAAKPQIVEQISPAKRAGQ